VPVLLAGLRWRELRSWRRARSPWRCARSPWRCARSPWRCATIVHHTNLGSSVAICPLRSMPRLARWAGPNAHRCCGLAADPCSSCDFGGRWSGGSGQGR